MPNLASMHEAIAARDPQAPCLVWRDRRLTWGDVTDRSRRLASWLRAHGLGCHRERHELLGHECGQDVVALVLFNGPEYLEAMLGAYKARCAPANVNYRYTADELAAVLTDMRARVVVHHRSLAATVREALGRAGLVPEPLLLEVDDEGAAASYEQALASAEPAEPAGLTGDDLYVLFTGGTTGRPKGVLWRQDDFAAAALGVRAASAEEVAAAVRADARPRALPTAPFMHGAAHWNAWSCWLAGGCVVVQSEVHRLDPADVWDTAERERVSSLQLVGDAFAVPLIDELARRPRDLSRLRFVMSGGVTLSPVNKRRLLELIPDVTILDIVGSSESGRQGVATSTRAGDTGGFRPSDGAVVVDETRTRVLDRADRSIGWLAMGGPTPLGYLGDPLATERTFPVVEGRRLSVPGDRARWREDGTIELLGRDAAVINTGGEKVFAEEVEQALRHHPAVRDVLVVGRPSTRWGSEVVAVAAIAAGHESVSDEELVAPAAEQLARYKLPKAIVRCAEIRRTASGKPDYAWARALAAEAASGR